MKFMMIVKGSKNSEAGIMPDEGLLSRMHQYNEELMKAGALVDLAGLQPSSKGARVKISADKRIVTDGPFAETKEIIAGYWIIQAGSLQEAIEWAKRVPHPHPNSKDQDCEIEVRPIYEPDDFTPCAAVESAKKLGAELSKAR
jgi:hypothetical protein